MICLLKLQLYLSWIVIKFDRPCYGRYIFSSRRMICFILSTLLLVDMASSLTAITVVGEGPLLLGGSSPPRRPFMDSWGSPSPPKKGLGSMARLHDGTGANNPGPSRRAPRSPELSLRATAPISPLPMKDLPSRAGLGKGPRGRVLDQAVRLDLPLLPYPRAGTP